MIFNLFEQFLNKLDKPVTTRIIQNTC